MNVNTIAAIAMTNAIPACFPLRRRAVPRRQDGNGETVSERNAHHSAHPSIVPKCPAEHRSGQGGQRNSDCRRIRDRLSPPIIGGGETVVILPCRLGNEIVQSVNNFATILKVAKIYAKSHITRAKYNVNGLPADARDLSRV